MKATTKRTSARVVRERENLEAMMRLFCQDQHSNTSHALCRECQQLFEYFLAHAASCHLGPDKPICEHCSFDCFIPARAEQIKAVIEATRGRMLLQHPQMSLRHWVDSLHAGHPRGFRGTFSSWGSE